MNPTDTRLWTPLRLILAFVLGGIGGAALDQIHVRMGVLYYATPLWFDQAWWVVPLFGAATVATITGARMWVDASPTMREHELLDAGSWFVAAYWASGQWQAHPIGLLVAYVIAFLVRTQHRPTWWFALALAVCGLVVEATISATGAFSYYHPDLFGLPLWLPGLYLHAAPFGLAVTTKLRR